MSIANYDIRQIKDGWTVHHTDGWAVMERSKENAIALFEEQKEFRRELIKRPFWYENPDNPDYNPSS